MCIRDSYNGLLNGFLSALGLENFMHSWLGEQATALGALVFYQFPWVAGIQFLIFLAGLQGIDTSIYEATKIDGIGPVSRIFYIDIPLLTGQFRYLIITTIISTFQTFEHVLIMTNGGPGDSTIVPALHKMCIRDRCTGLPERPPRFPAACMDCVAGGKSGCIYEFPGIGGVFLQTQSICR